MKDYKNKTQKDESTKDESVKDESPKVEKKAKKTGGKYSWFLPKYGKSYGADTLQEAVELAEKDNK